MFFTLKLISSYCEKEMLRVLFTHSINLSFIGFGYIKATTIKRMTKAKAILKSRI